MSHVHAIRSGTMANKQARAASNAQHHKRNRNNSSCMYASGTGNGVTSSRGAKSSRFYAVVKEAKPVSGPACKRKTRYSQNPPVESHVGWVLDERPKSSGATNRNSFSTSGNVAITAAQASMPLRDESHSQDLPPFQHPSYSLLQQNGFTQQLYSKFRKHCLAGGCFMYYE